MIRFLAREVFYWLLVFAALCALNPDHPGENAIAAACGILAVALMRCTARWLRGAR